MFHLEAVCLVGFVVEGVQFVHGQLVEFIEVVPPFVPGTQLGVQVGVGDVTAHLGSHIERTHGQYVYPIAGDGTEGGGNGFHNPCVDSGALAGGDVNPHAGAAEQKGSLKIAFGNLCAHTKTYTVEHIFGVFHIRVGYAQVRDLPALGSQVFTYGFLQRISGKIGADYEIFVLYGLHTLVLLYGKV